jgi:hypothetical protein
MLRLTIATLLFFTVVANAAENSTTKVTALISKACLAKKAPCSSLNIRREFPTLFTVIMRLGIDPGSSGRNEMLLTNRWVIRTAYYLVEATKRTAFGHDRVGAQVFEADDLAGAIQFAEAWLIRWRHTAPSISCARIVCGDVAEKDNLTQWIASDLHYS